VQVIDPRDSIIRRDASVTDHCDFRRTQWASAGAPRPATVISAAVTNAGGHCIVHGDLGIDNLVMRVSIGEQHVYLEQDIKFGKDHLTRKIELDD
jgi:hypothetical protein